MPLWLQHALVLFAVAGSLAVVLRGAYATFRGRRSKIGSCCDKGCAAQGTTSKNGTERIVFLPVDALKKRR